jgi:hypothetical protein
VTVIAGLLSVRRTAWYAVVRVGVTAALNAPFAAVRGLAALISYVLAHSVALSAIV